MKLKVENRDLVVPGELLAEGDCLLGEGTFKREGKAYASLLGLVDVNKNFIKIIPLSGKYMPDEGDLVIGIVTDISFSRWSVDLNSAFSGTIRISNAAERYVEKDEDLSEIYDVGDTVLAKVLDVSKTTTVGLTMKEKGLHKLSEGSLIYISPAKVPRVIGRKGTMVQTLKKKTNCKIVVGQNGRVWINGEYPNLAAEAIYFIEREAQSNGLTEKVEDFLDEKLKERKKRKKPKKTDKKKEKKKSGKKSKKGKKKTKKKKGKKKSKQKTKKKLKPKKVKEKEEE